MAIKGNAYLKTTWSFEERPVASSKLNNWDDRIEAAIELAYFLLSQTWGGGDGVFRNIDGALHVLATSPAGMSVEVQPGYAFISNNVYRLSEATQSVDLAAPATDSRIDIVQARIGAWDINVKPGTEDPSPIAPTADADAIAIAQIYLRPGMSSIKDTDDGVNGYIIDTRQFL